MDALTRLFEFLEKNQNLASAAAAMTSAAAAILALIVSAAAVGVAVVTARQQRTHNTLTVKPIPEVTVGDYEDSLRVKLRNHGSGPLTVKSLVASFQGKSCQSLIDCMPNLERDWTNFAGIIDGRTLLPGDEIVLIELSAEQKEQGFEIHRDLARHALAHTTIVIQYTNIYDSNFPHYSKSLSWFGRNLE